MMLKIKIQEHVHFLATFFNEKHGIQSTTREVGLQASPVTFYLLTYTELKFGPSGRRLLSLKGAIIILTLEETFFLGYRAQNRGKKERGHARG